MNVSGPFKFMKYFKNTELARLYHVSEKSVRNWIDATVNGKLDLDLYEVDGRRCVANTTKNHDIIRALVNQRKKFTNGRGHKVVIPKPEFYDLFNSKQILDIIKNIDIYREIPHQYGYFDGGARFWDEYAHRLYRESAPNTLNKTIHLLKLNEEYILDQIGDHKVNVIDLGPGHSLPVKGLLGILLEKNMLNKYICIDLSKEVLEIASTNVEHWFDGRVEQRQYVRDITRESFDDIVAEETLVGDGTINLVLLFGGTLSTVRQPDHTLQLIRYSMNRNDIFAYSKKLDSGTSRRYFDFTVNKDALRLPFQEMIPNVLGIDQSFYELEQLYDEEQRMRTIQMKMRIDVTVEFEIDQRKHQLKLQKGDVILLWRSWHQTAKEVIDQFDYNGFDVLQSSLTGDLGYIMAVAKMKQNTTSHEA